MVLSLKIYDQIFSCFITSALKFNLRLVVVVVVVFNKLRDRDGILKEKFM